MSDYYNSLFVIQVTVFGIGFAGLIALMQVLRPLLSFKSTQRMIKGTMFIATSALLVASILSTSISTLLLSLKGHDFLWFDAHTDMIIHSEWFAILNLLIVIVTFVGLVWAVIQETKYLIPSNALAFLAQQTTPEVIRPYFEDTYLPVPTPTMHVRFYAIASDGTQERSDEELNDEYEQKLADYNRRKARVANKENPLLPLESYLMQAVRRDDLQASQAALRSLEDVVIAVARSEYYEILYELVKYYSTIIDNCMELAGAHGLQSVLLEAVESTDRIATELVERKRVSELNPLIDLWQAIGDEHMGRQPAVFRSVMATVRSTGEGIINETSIETDKMKETVDNIDRCLGWLGERMLAKSKPEEKMLMNLMYETEFSALMNAVLGVGYAFERNRPDIYPLIHYDCLYVIADKLAPYCTDPKRDTDNRNTLFSLMYEIETFAERAIDEGNVRGASLSVLRLKEHYDIAKENGLEEQMEHCLVAMMDVGAYAAGRRLQGAAEFLRAKTIPDETIRLISENIGRVNLNSEATEIIVKHPMDVEHGDIVDYLIKLGDELGTDFGLNLKRSGKKI